MNKLKHETQQKEFSQQDQQCLQDIMRWRRDVRGNHFINKPVPDDAITKILHAASLAPSVGFSQPWEFVLIHDTEIKKQIAASFELENKKAEKQFSDEKQKNYAQLKLEGIREAPLNMAVFYKPTDKPVLGQNTMSEMGEYSVVCAVQNMWLMARALNIGMGWVSILNPNSVKQILQSPPENKLVAYLCVGYVDGFYEKPELELLQWESKKSIHAAIHLNTYPKPA